MSAFMCNTETVRKALMAVHWLCREIDGTHCEYVAGIPFADLGPAMARMNAESVKALYPGRYQPLLGGDDIDPEEYRFYIARRLPDGITPAACYKALHCWLYQSCEGKQDQSDLWQCLDSILVEMAKYLVTQMPDYKAAQWGD